MKVDIFWLVVILLVVGFVGWRLSALAGRIDRLHHRIDLCPVILVGRGRDADRIHELIRLAPARSLFLAEQLDFDLDRPFD